MPTKTIIDKLERADGPDRVKVSAAMRGAVEWLRERGGECAAAKTIAGGRVYLAQGEIGPFQPVTIKKLIEAGMVERVIVSQMKAARYRLIVGDAALRARSQGGE